MLQFGEEHAHFTRLCGPMRCKYIPRDSNGWSSPVAHGARTNVYTKSYSNLKYYQRQLSSAI